MSRRNYGRDIGYVALALGVLMMIAGLGFGIIGSLMPPVDSRLGPPPGVALLFEHPLPAGLGQFTMGALLTLSARAFQRGKVWGRSVLRLALAVVFVSLAAFSVLWVSSVWNWGGEMPLPGGSHSFAVYAGVVSLTWLVPLGLAVRYLGTPQARLESPMPSSGSPGA